MSEDIYVWYQVEALIICYFDRYPSIASTSLMRRVLGFRERAKYHYAKKTNRK